MTDTRESFISYLNISRWVSSLRSECERVLATRAPLTRFIRYVHLIFTVWSHTACLIMSVPIFGMVLHVSGVGVRGLEGHVRYLSGEHHNSSELAGSDELWRSPVSP